MTQMDWQKDPVLMEMRGNIRFLGWAVFVLFVVVCFCLCLHSRPVSPETHPTTATLADAEWREIGRRIDVLEKPSPAPLAVDGPTISSGDQGRIERHGIINYDPDVFTIDARGRLTLKAATRPRPDQAIIHRDTVRSGDAR